MVDLHLAASEQEALHIALKRLKTMDPAAKVGAVHHTVPKFYLRRFARGEQVLTRAPGEVAVRTRNIRDMGQRDFYTAVVDAEGLACMQAAENFPDEQAAAAWRQGTGPATLDGRIEDVLATVDDWGAAVLARLTDTPERALTREERYALTTFLAFQLTRGVRTRREIELIGEYYAKTMLRPVLSAKALRRTELAAAARSGRTPARGNGRRLPAKQTRGDNVLTDGQLRRIGIRPSANEHLSMFSDVADSIGEHVFLRPVTVVELDKPMLVTCDEPVVVVGGLGEDEHTSACSMTGKQRRKALADAISRGVDHREQLHLYPTRSKAVAVAEMISIPIDPTRALVLGSKNTGAPAHVRLEGDNAAAFTEDLNGKIVAQAYLWVVGHPVHADLSSLTIPEPGPLIMACDGGSPASETTNRPPEPRSTNRLRRTDWR